MVQNLDQMRCKGTTKGARASDVHSGPKCLPRVACLWSKMPMFQRVRMREGEEPHPLAFHDLILMI